MQSAIEAVNIVNYCLFVPVIGFTVWAGVAALREKLPSKED